MHMNCENENENEKRHYFRLKLMFIVAELSSLLWFCL